VSSVDAEWVTRYLLTYCGPGRHEFRSLDSHGRRWCTVCYKEEASGTCRICDASADRMCRLPQHPVIGDFKGELCDHCIHGLEDLASTTPRDASAR
jgi:hypothetical protein